MPCSPGLIGPRRWATTPVGSACWPCVIASPWAARVVLIRCRWNHQYSPVARPIALLLSVSSIPMGASGEWQCELLVGAWRDRSRERGPGCIPGSGRQRCGACRSSNHVGCGARSFGRSSAGEPVCAIRVLPPPPRRYKSARERLPPVAVGGGDDVAALRAVAQVHSDEQRTTERALGGTIG